MKKNSVVISRFFLIVCAVAIPHLTFSQLSDDNEAITKTALDYIEGWYSGDTARIASALAPGLVKRGFITDHRTGKLIISEASYSQMVDWTGRKPDEFKQNPSIKIEVKIIETGKNIAIVKTISPAYIDYIHMGKYNGKWKIYNVIWEPNQPAAI